MASSLNDASLTLPSWAEVINTLTLSAGYNTAIVMLGTTALGIASGLVGTFLLLRKRALMSDALAHSTLPGICVAYLVLVFFADGTKSLGALLLGATISGLLGTLCVLFLVRHTRIREDAAIGAVLSVFFGVGIVLLSIIQNLSAGSAGGLSTFIYGQTAATGAGDAWILAFSAVGALILSLLFLKEFRLLCFDSPFAQVQGWPVLWIDLILMTLVICVTIIGLQIVGLLLVVALLIIPAVSARFWSERLTAMLILSALIGGISGFLGSAISALLPRAPAGAVIVLTGAFFFLFSFLFAPKRGVFAHIVRLFALRLRVAEEHLLRGAFEAGEAARSDSATLQLPADFSLPWWLRIPLALRLRWYGFVSRGDDGRTRLSPAGVRRASLYTRNHRLWEEYTVNVAGTLPSHVDLTADLVEHVLSPELVRSLEASLAKRGLLPKPDEVPSSVHPPGGRE